MPSDATERRESPQQALPHPIENVVSKCESYAEELFDDDKYFTQVTKWQDGDFRVLVHHGKGYGDAPYRSRAEKVTYRHHDGVIVYVDETRLIDHHTDETHESRELEQYDQAVETETMKFDQCPDCGGGVEYYEHGQVFCRECSGTFSHEIRDHGDRQRHLLWRSEVDGDLAQAETVTHYDQ